ncbi:MAG TPA: hypothetical protein VK169_15220 [Saprospiraceae bacterium]|nr:hypothetical protein [Saprospiraceae bacterium]
METSDKEIVRDTVIPKTNYIGLFMYICLSILALTIIYFLAINYLSPESNRNETRGTFGDLFGGLNAIFSGFAFAGVIITILMQMKELELTRDELKKSVIAQDKSQKAINSQLKHMQSATRVESVKNIVDVYDEREDNDKKEIAKQILERLTESILYDEEFLDIVTPNFEIMNKPKIQGNKVIKNGSFVYEKYDQSKQNNTFIVFKNKGISFKITHKIISQTSNNLRITYKQIISKNIHGSINISEINLPHKNLIDRDAEIKMIIENITNENQISIEIELEGNFIKHKFNQKIILNINSAVLDVELGPVNIIKGIDNI